MIRLETKNLGEFQAAAREYARSLTPLPARATVVGLYGNLGAGKTTFVQAVARALGVKEKVASPTFLIMKSYKLFAFRFEFLVHLDAYRLNSGEDLRKLGFEKLLADPHNLVFIEWANRVADILPKGHIKFHFDFIDDATRHISFSYSL